MRFRWAAVLVACWLMLVGGPALAEMSDDLRAGYQAYRSGQFEQAAQAFGRAIDDGQLDRAALAVTLNNRGVAYSQLGRYDAAIADYLAARDLKADDPTTIRNLRFAYVTRGLAAANKGERPAALLDYDRALEVDPAYLEALQYRGALLVEMGSNADAEADFRRVLTLQPGNPAAVAALAALDDQPANAAPAPLASAPADAAVPLAAEGTAPDSVQAAVARTQAAQDRAQAALDDALQAARAVEPTAAPEAPAPTEPEVEPSAPDAASQSRPDAAASADTATPPPPSEAAPRQEAEVAPPPEPAPRPAARAASEPSAPVEEAPAEVAAAAPADPPAAQAARRFRVTTSVNLRGGPGNSFGVIGSLEPGMVVSSDAEELGWYRISRGSGRAGWVYRRFLAPAE